MSGFLFAEGLSEPLRKPYHQGDANVTVAYLVAGLEIGQHRVLLKKNFDTACWVPPAGSKASHSIYYGDRMLDRIFTRFCKLEGLSMPADEFFVAEARKDFEPPKSAKAMGPKAMIAALMAGPSMTTVFNLKVQWLWENLTDAQWTKLRVWLEKAVQSYGRHEREHARRTPRDLKQVNKDLALWKVPFQIFNLFEDSRIEAFSRRELETPFEWTLFEDLAPADNPFNIYLRCIQLEEAVDTEALASTATTKSGKTVGDIAKRVDHYYRRAIVCATAEELYPIMREFLDEFKDEMQPPKDPDNGEGEGEGEGEGSGSGSGSGKGKGKGKGEGEGSGNSDSDSGKGDKDGSGKGKGKKDEGEGSSSEGSGSGEGEDEGEGSGSGAGSDAGERAGDLSVAAEAAEKGDEFFAEFDADAEVVEGNDAEGKEAKAKAKAKAKAGKTPPPKKGDPSQGIPDSIGPVASGGRAQEHHFLAKTSGTIDPVFAKRVDNLTQMLLRLFKAHTLTAYKEDPAHRISSRHLARGELRFVHKKVFGGKGKRKFSIVFDCSGSMSGKPQREGKLLLLALNRLARMGWLENSSLILSGFPNGKPGWLTYSLPVKDEVILSINPHHGSEGIQAALEDNLKLVKGMDDVFVYTDACICDTPLNRAMFASHKVWPVGLYVGDESAATEMDRHFPQNIIRNTIEEVVEGMLIRNRRGR